MILSKKPCLLLTNSSFCPIHRGIMQTIIPWRFVFVADPYKAPPQKSTGKPKSERGGGLFSDWPVNLFYCGPLVLQFFSNCRTSYSGLFLACLLIVLTHLFAHGRTQSIKMFIQSLHSPLTHDSTIEGAFSQFSHIITLY